MMSEKLARDQAEPLRVLYVEDSQDDAELTVAALEKAGYRCDWQRVQNEEQLLRHLDQTYDLILSDYRLPGFDGLAALKLVREHDQTTPFILVSGAIGEERAIESLKAGATDYVLKDRLARLVPVVQRALNEQEQRRSRQRAEVALATSEVEQDRLSARLASTLDALPAHVALLDQAGTIVAVNQAWKRFAEANHYRGMGLGVGTNYLEICDATRGPALAEGRAAAHGIRSVLSSAVPQFAMEYSCHAPTQRRWFRMVVTPAAEGRPEGAVVMHLDISDRRMVEVALRYRADLESLLMNASRRFVESRPDQVDGAINYALERIGSFLGIDWTFLLLLSPERDVVNCTHEWCAPGLPQRKELYREIRVEDMLWSARAPWREPLVVDRVESLPAEMAAEKALLHAAGVRSTVLVPMVYGDSLMGVLGFASISEVCDWSADELPLLKVMAELLVNAIARQRAALALEADAESDAAVARFGQELIASLGAPETLERLCRVTAEVLGCSSSHTLLWDADERVFKVIAGFGQSDEEREAARLVSLPRQMISGILERLAVDEVTEGATTPLEALLLPPHRSSLQLCMALRRGRDLIGIQIAGRGEGGAPFRLVERRIAGRIARLSSLALEHARVLEELERSNRLKSDFVATMSHELRTPLNIIIGYNELMIEGAFGPLQEEQGEYARRIRRSAGDLLALIDETLDLRRIERGRMEVVRSDVEVKPFFTQLAADLQQLGESSKVQIGLRLPRKKTVIRTDATKLKTIVRNLMVNAIKFSEGGKVTVTVRARKAGVAIVVADSGVGIEPEMLPVIFDAFRQGEEAATRRFGGVGLGLYIVRRLLDLLEGTIEVQSTVGEGSTFSLWLPSE